MTGDQLPDLIPCPSIGLHPLKIAGGDCPDSQLEFGLWSAFITYLHWLLSPLGLCLLEMFAKLRFLLPGAWASLSNPCPDSPAVTSPLGFLPSGLFMPLCSSPHPRTVSVAPASICRFPSHSSFQLHYIFSFHHLLSCPSSIRPLILHK